VFFAPTRTDADGRWSFSGVPEHSDGVAVGTYHHLYLTGENFFPVDHFEPESALRNHSAVLKLRRGTRIDGTVVGPDGRPVPGAVVLYGPDKSQAVNSIPPVTADAHGRFTLGIAPGAISVLTARGAGFGPALETIRVGTEPQHVTLALQPPRSVAGRVADSAGRPIAGATLSVGSWRGVESLEEDITTDADGRFLWKEAPADEVRTDVYAKGYVRRSDVPMIAGAPNRIVMTSPTSVKGTVVDAGTGQPIPRFSLEHGTVWNAGERVIWQRNMRADEEAKKDPGSFEWTFGEQVHQLIVRVVAEGYLPADSGLFAQDRAVREFTFRLTKANPIRGTVFDPNGSPAREGSVYLVAAGEDIELNNGDVPAHWRDGRIHAQVAPGGQFTLPPQNGDWLLVALADAGFAVVHQRDLPRDNALRLQPWGRVSGTVRLGTRPAAELTLRMQPREAHWPSGEVESRIFRHDDFRTDANGRFQLPRVMPGHYDVIHVVPNGVRRMTFVKMAEVNAAAGRSGELTIGGIGRPVVGRVVLPANVPWMVRNAAVDRQTATGKRLELGVQISVDGRFRAENVAPGEYKLRISIHEPPPDDECGWGRLIGEFSREFSVSPISGGVSDDPLDLGDLEAAPANRHPLQVGDIAPDFAVTTLDGKDLRLADLNGKLVLLHFWATWCAPCVAELPDLKTVRDTFAAEPRFEMLSLSLDVSPAILKERLRSLKAPWRQAFIGPDSSVAAAYGAGAIPATFLIGPDLRIVAKDLRGENVKTTIADTLKRLKAGE
jgi:peroxiredoxin/protocatechuate 3,4-dioxygenase beta subunit